MTKESDMLNRAARRQREPRPARKFARYGSRETAARVMRKVRRRMIGLRTADMGLVAKLDEAFGLGSPLQLLAFGIGRPDFDDHERRRRRAAGKRQRAARRAGRQ